MLNNLANTTEAMIAGCNDLAVYIIETDEALSISWPVDFTRCNILSIIWRANKFGDEFPDRISKAKYADTS